MITNEKHIYIRLNHSKTYRVCYKICISRGNFRSFDKTFKSIYDAIEYRNRVVLENPPRERITRDPLYSIWEGIMARTGIWKTKDKKMIRNYITKGITVCSEWESFEKFRNDIPTRPSKKHQLDRIDNSKGYFLDNVRWVLNSINSFNRTIKNNKCGFRGVGKHGPSFRVSITKDGIHYRKSGFNTAEEAYEFYKQKALDLYGFLPKNKIAK